MPHFQRMVDIGVPPPPVQFPNYEVIDDVCCQGSGHIPSNFLTGTHCAEPTSPQGLPRLSKKRTGNA